jgi:hypothetical protein
VHLKVSNTAGESIETGLAVSSEDFRTYVKLGIVDLGSEMHLVWESDLYVVQTHREIRNELTLETDVWLRLVKFGNRTFNAFWRSGPKNGWTPLTPAISRDLGPTRLGCITVSCFRCFVLKTCLQIRNILRFDRLEGS